MGFFKTVMRYVLIFFGFPDPLIRELREMIANKQRPIMENGLLISRNALEREELIILEQGLIDQALTDPMKLIVTGQVMMRMRQFAVRLWGNTFDKSDIRINLQPRLAKIPPEQKNETLLFMRELLIGIVLATLPCDEAEATRLVDTRDEHEEAKGIVEESVEQFKLISSTFVSARHALVHLNKDMLPLIGRLYRRLTEFLPLIGV